MLVGPAVELWPTVLLGSPHLRGLSLFAKIEFGVNHQAVVDPTNMPVGPTTFWGNIEIDVKHHWDIGDSGAFEASGGFVRDQMQYNAPSATELALVPEVDYKSLRLGVRGIAKLGSVEPYIAGEGRIVLSEGALATRFDKVDVTGFKGAVGLGIHAGPISGHLEAAVMYYGWTITENSTTMPSASGARDLVEMFSLWLGYNY